MSITAQGLKQIRESYLNNIKSFAIVSDEGTELFRIPVGDSRVQLVSNADQNPIEYKVTVKGTDTEVVGDISVKGIKIYDATSGGNVITEYTYSTANIIQDGTEASVIFDYKFNVNA